MWPALTLLKQSISFSLFWTSLTSSSGGSSWRHRHTRCLPSRNRCSNRDYHTYNQITKRTWPHPPPDLNWSSHVVCELLPALWVCTGAPARSALIGPEVNHLWWHEQLAAQRSAFWPERQSQKKKTAWELHVEQNPQISDINVFYTIYITEEHQKQKSLFSFSL